VGEGEQGQAPVAHRRRRPRGVVSFRFSLGDALGKSFGFYGRHIVAFGLIAIAVHAPMGLWRLAAARRVWERMGRLTANPFYRPATFWVQVQQELGLLGTAVGILLALALQAVVALAVFQYLRGGSIQYGRSLREGAGRMHSVIGVVALLALLAIAISFVAGLILIPLVASSGGGVGFVLLFAAVAVVGLAVIQCIFFVAVPVTVVERVGPAASMARSAWLTKRARWQIFVIVLVVGIVQYAADAIVRSWAGANPATWSRAEMGILLSTATTALTALFAATCCAVTYHELRKAKEGVGIDDLLKVFS
jgi:hypothetical protein